MRMNIKEVARVFSAVVVVAYSQSALGQTTDSQVFNVVVPTLVSITAPSTDTIDTTDPADQTDGPMTFTGDNIWTCTCNAGNGANVAFTADGPFENNGDLVAAGLALAVDAANSNVAANWTVDVPTGNTGTASATAGATVSASSDSPGTGSLELTVTFDNSGTYSDLVAGTYSMTVTGTITANPVP